MKNTKSNATKSNAIVTLDSLDSVYQYNVKKLLENNLTVKVNNCSGFYVGIGSFSINKSKTKSEYTVYCDDFNYSLFSENDEFKKFCIQKNRKCSGTDLKLRNNVIRCGFDDIAKLIDIVCENYKNHTVNVVNC